jgi:hypothetical protein
MSLFGFVSDHFQLILGIGTAHRTYIPQVGTSQK